MNQSSTGIENSPILKYATKVVGDTLGTLLLGTFLSIILYGTGVHQAYRYFRLYPNDTLVIQGIVITMLLLETAQTVFSMHTCYYYLVTKYSHLDLRGVWSSNLIAVSASIIAILSQLFFLRRISLISFKYKIISATSVVFLLWSFGCTIYISYLGFKDGAPAMFSSHKWLTPMGYATITVVNTLVTGSLLAVLICAREHTIRPRIADFLTIYIVNTGVLVLACDLITLVLAITLSSTFYWVVFALMGSNLYEHIALSIKFSKAAREPRYRAIRHKHLRRQLSQPHEEVSNGRTLERSSASRRTSTDYGEYQGYSGSRRRRRPRNIFSHQSP
ncbi:hypothetical protein C8Q74DRAFT_666241 [Fomes fomentarius]|nr:hypothetical protein C8Q74DRAFT_666241 [Fomes fomentarius]